ncbi:hypothetical protein ALI44B_01010 [Leifsonia sp. ALI-44-B]|nr:hypothetical protein ALI44B_01010 [Leifsonia sp. ALI-44-B]
MPRLTHPPHMPKKVVEAIEVLGNRARTEILHMLGRNDGLTVPEIAERLDLSRVSAHAHLQALERAGLVSTDVPLEQRRGRLLHWHVDPAAVAQLAAVWAKYASGEEN